MEDKIVESEIKEYFGIKVEAFTTVNSLKHYSSFPWRFRIFQDGEVRNFYGIPNYVETKAKALKRAWYRAKWLSEGTYNEKYK